MIRCKRKDPELFYVQSIASLDEAIDQAMMDDRYDLLPGLQAQLGETLIKARAHLPHHRFLIILYTSGMNLPYFYFVRRLYIKHKLRNGAAND